MKAALVSLLAAASSVSAHATWQELWVNGVDQAGVCVRLPNSNNPLTDVSASSIRCNLNQGPAASKCAVNAGGKVTIEMHQQPGDRSCANEAIGGDHFGPVIVYMSKVDDSSTADGSSGWFKIGQDTWSATHLGDGSKDNWGTKDLNANCGKMDFTIPCDIAAGDYLLRAEVIALHVAGSPNGAQFYASCYQLTVTGGGGAKPGTVLFPGAYKSTDPGILINIYQPLSTYIAPGPTVYAPAGCAGGGSPPTTARPTTPTTTTRPPSTTTTVVTTARPTTISSPRPTVVTTTTTALPSGNCAAKYGQCGGQGWTGPTCCQAGSMCKASSQYYSQCL